MAPSCSRSWELFAGLATLFLGVEGQLSASDGLCQRFGHQSALVGDKLVLAGGFRVVRDPGSGAVTEQSTNDFQSLDLGPDGTSFRLGRDSQQNGPQWQSINYTVNGAAGLPKVANGAMWRDKEDLYIYEGRLPGLGPDASSSLWKYTANTSVWGQELTWSHRDSNLPNRVSRGGSVSVGDYGIGVYVGGARIFVNDSATPKSGNWYYPSEEQLTTFNLRNLNRTTTSLPDSQKRMGAALGYLPIGTAGAIIGIGGTLENDEIREIGNVSNIATENFDPDDINFTPMQSVWIMDLDTRKWYSQSTFGTYIPESRMEHCIAIASAPDFSSHNIYMFGGSTASSFLNRSGEKYFNELYILSIPSFRWIRKTFEVSENVPAGRVQHTCHVHGKNMIILGGATQNSTECTWDEVNILDMSTLTWITDYRYSADDEFSVPQLVMGSISNNGKIQTDPVNGWDDHDLEALFKVNSGGNTMVKIAAVAGGVAGGIILAFILVAGFYHYKRKREYKQEQEALRSKFDIAYEPSRADRQSRYDPDPIRDGGAMELHSSSPSSVTSTFDESSGYAHPGKLWRASYHSYEVSEADVDYPDNDNDRTRLILDTKVPTGYFELGNPSTPTAMERHELGGGDLGEQRIQEVDNDPPSPISSRGTRWR
ncbi:hypothetical protein TWF730_008438 [Orbilia blumenaviensis]|uniref:Kelch repeat protein n=1 Tax=Orbilia blumenaviensis TaxID=1796055 RepID=A0AAV9V2M5_9PEZI